MPQETMKSFQADIDAAEELKKIISDKNNGTEYRLL